MNKKILLVTLILSIYIPSILQIASLHFRILQEQEKGKMRIFAESKKVLLSFSLDEASRLIVWKERNEFEYNGQMFDVYEKKLTQDSIFIICVADDKETTIRNELKLSLAGLFGNNTFYKKNFAAFNDFAKSLFPPEYLNLGNDASYNGFYSFISIFKKILVIHKILKPPIAFLS